MSSQAHSDRSEAPLTRRDMRGFLADFKKSVAEELDKRLCPILEGMADLSARAQATEAKMADTDERIQAHGTEIQYLRDQLRSLEETNEDLNNRTRRNNIRAYLSSQRHLTPTQISHHDRRHATICLPEMANANIATQHCKAQMQRSSRGEEKGGQRRRNGYPPPYLDAPSRRLRSTMREPTLYRTT
ncbi:Hypothetical predicted protein [Pelobates cultripes]|uniref:Uncharacterized protein n=1 Tax=Pelobates cultripes TaxID=61616 RepID=A0AAD1TF07_PELCU|nr:Hypothetical predicted protein [Pelobates cultripes]